MLCFNQNKWKKGLLESLLQQTGLCGGAKHWAGQQLSCSWCHLMLLVGSLRRQEMLQTGASGLAFRLLWWRTAPRVCWNTGSGLCAVFDQWSLQIPESRRLEKPSRSWSPTCDQSPGVSATSSPSLSTSRGGDSIRCLGQGAGTDIRNVLKLLIPACCYQQ